MALLKMNLNESLITEIDKVVKHLKITREEFTRKALQDEIKKYNIKQLEKKHREGYIHKPVKHKEFNIWEKEQIWIE